MYSIDISQLIRLAETFPCMATILGDEVKKAMTDCGMYLGAALAARITETSKNTGLLAASVAYPEGFTSSGDPMGTYTGTIQASGRVGMFGHVTSIYSNYVEFGIEPTFPPLAPLEYWITRKFGASGKYPDIGDVSRQARMLQLYIGHRGIAAKENFKFVWESKGKRHIEKTFQKVPAKVIRRWEAL